MQGEEVPAGVARAPKGARNMSMLKSCATLLPVAAMAALLGASCASSDKPVDTGDDTKGDHAVGSDPEEQRVWPAPVPPGGGSCAGYWNGVWCGGNLGFPGSPYALYYCNNGISTLVANCPGLCHSGPIGTEDHC